MTRWMDGKDHIFNHIGFTQKYPINLNGELVVFDIDIKYKNLIMSKMSKVDDMDRTWIYEQLPMTFPTSC
jgi:hypothetical protein